VLYVISQAVESKSHKSIAEIVFFVNVSSVLSFSDNPVTVSPKEKLSLQAET